MSAKYAVIRHAPTYDLNSDPIVCHDVNGKKIFDRNEALKLVEDLKSFDEIREAQSNYFIIRVSSDWEQIKKEVKSLDFFELYKALKVIEITRQYCDLLWEKIEEIDIRFNFDILDFDFESSSFEIAGLRVEIEEEMKTRESKS